MCVHQTIHHHIPDDIEDLSDRLKDAEIELARLRKLEAQARRNASEAKRLRNAIRRKLVQQSLGDSFAEGEQL